MKIDLITPTTNFILQVRFIKEDGSYHRKCYAPDIDIDTIEYEQVKDKAKEFWTPTVVQDYKDSLNIDTEILDA